MALSNFAKAKVVALNPYAYFFYSVLYVDLWLLIAPHKVIALPTLATAMIVYLYSSLLHFKARKKNRKEAKRQ